MWVLPKFRNYLVFYRLQGNVEDLTVEIVRVLQGNQPIGADYFKE